MRVLSINLFDADIRQGCPIERFLLANSIFAIFQNFIENAFEARFLAGFFIFGQGGNDYYLF